MQKKCFAIQIRWRYMIRDVWAALDRHNSTEGIHKAGIHHLQIVLQALEARQAVPKRLEERPLPAKFYFNQQFMLMHCDVTCQRFRSETAGC